MKIVSIEGHPHRDELAAYVSDTLEPQEVDRIESHVFECEVCATRLQQAASFQMMLHDAAAAMEAEAQAPTRPAPRRRWRVSATSGLWAAAAAMVLMVCQQGGRVLTDDQTQTLLLAEATTSLEASQLPGEPAVAMGDGLLASVDPLESVDPLQTWPDDPFGGSDWAGDDAVDGEPCGSGEDGGTLVCRQVSG